MWLAIDVESHVASIGDKPSVRIVVPWLPLTRNDIEDYFAHT